MKHKSWHPSQGGQFASFFREVASKIYARWNLRQISSESMTKLFDDLERYCWQNFDILIGDNIDWMTDWQNILTIPRSWSPLSTFTDLPVYPLNYFTFHFIFFQVNSEGTSTLTSVLGKGTLHSLNLVFFFDTFTDLPALSTKPCHFSHKKIQVDVTGTSILASVIEMSYFFTLTSVLEVMNFS